MGHSKADKRATHERIVKIASARFRERGIDGIGVADLMKEAGITVGGFYKHFESREQLVVEALVEAFLDGEVVGTSGRGLAKDIKAYLSVKHRDDPGAGCAMGALLGNVSRAGAAARREYTEQFRTNLDRLSAALVAESSRKQRAKALSLMCTLFGAINLARAVDDAKLSKDILRSVAEELIWQHAVNE